MYLDGSEGMAWRQWWHCGVGVVWKKGMVEVVVWEIGRVFRRLESRTCW